MKFYAGIDPGKSGFIAIVVDDRVLAFRIPTYKVGKTKKEYDRREILDVIKRLAEGAVVGLDKEGVHVVIEKQQIMPKQGASSAFTIGFGYGLLVMALEGRVPYSEVTPSVWKREMALTLPSKDTKGMSPNVRKKRLKEIALREAQRLFPGETFIPEGGRTPNADMAEAVLLAEWGRRKSL